MSLNIIITLKLDISSQFDIFCLSIHPCSLFF